MDIWKTDVNAGDEMKHWIFYGIIASFAYGISAIPLKYATGKNFLAAPFSVVALGQVAGIILVLAVYLFCINQLDIKAFFGNIPAFLWGACSGIIGTIGTIAILLALNKPSTEVSRLMAVVSTSVLVTVVFSFFLLKEVPVGLDKAKVALAAVFIIMGIRLIVY